MKTTTATLMLRTALIGSLCWLVSAAGIQAAEHDGETDLILILDASNSMWGQIDGINKIVIARDAVGKLIDELPDGSDVGLIAYGHRREGDCEDIEVLEDIGTVDKAALKQTINSISPKGKTPITASITAAVELVRAPTRAAIVLISDGLETCGLDPCAAVRTAKKSGTPFVLHVVGFDIADEDAAELECAAQAGDGLYLSANDAGQLSEALQTAYEKPAVPDGRLIVGTSADGALQDAVVAVVDAASGADVAGGRTYTSSNTNPRRIPLEDGRYRAEVRAIGIKGSPKFSFEFEILDGNAVEKSFDYSAGEVAVEVRRNGALSDAVVAVRAQDDGKTIAGGRTYRAANQNPTIIRIAAGTYDVNIKSVEMSNGPESLIENVVVNGGERTELSHEFSSGTLSLGARRGNTLVDAVLNVIDADGKNVAGGRTYTSANSNPKQIVLAPGVYTLRIAEIRGDKRERAAEVLAGETTEVVVDFDVPQPE